MNWSMVTAGAEVGKIVMGSVMGLFSGAVLCCVLMVATEHIWSNLSGIALLGWFAAWGFVGLVVTYILINLTRRKK